jgi:hypothetical protein
VDDYVRADAVNLRLTTSELSFGAWIKPTAAVRGSPLSFNSADGSNRNMVFWSDSADSRFAYYDDSTGFRKSARTFSLDWHFVFVTIDASNNGKLYVDGNLEATFTTSVRPPTNGRFSIGQEWDGNTPSDFFKGIIDEVRVYNRALSAEEIKQQYLLGLPRHIYEDAISGEIYDSIPPGSTVKVIFPSPPDNEFFLVLSTDLGTYMSWRLAK